MRKQRQNVGRGIVQRAGDAGMCGFLQRHGNLQLQQHSILMHSLNLGCNVLIRELLYRCLDCRLRADTAVLDLLLTRSTAVTRHEQSSKLFKPLKGDAQFE
jgi:hypothetical protein